MSATVAEVLVKMKGEGADDVIRETGRAEKATKSMTDRIGGMGRKLTGEAALTVASFAGLTGPIIGLGALVVNSASDQNEAITKTQVVFGDSANDMIAWSNTAATSFGLSKTQALDTTATFGNMFTAMNFTSGEAATMSKDFIGLAADLGSFNNVPTPAALAAIQSGLVGEYEPLRAFGVMLSEAEVQNYALAEGIWDGTGAMTEQQKVLARQGLIYKQTTNAQDDFSRTSDGLANQTKILKAQLANLSAEFGQVLLPIAVKVTNGLNGLMGKFTGISAPVKTFIVILLGLAAAAGPVLIAISMMMPALAAIGGFFVTASGGVGIFAGVLAVLTGPIGLTIAAIVALGVAYKTNFLGFGDGVRKVGSLVSAGIGSIMSKFNELKVAFNVFRQMTDPVSASLKAIGLVFPGLTKYITPLVGKISQLKDVMGRISTAFNFFKSRTDPVSAVLKSLVTVFPGLGKVLNPIIDTIGKLTSAFDTFRSAGAGPVEAALRALSSVFPFLAGAVSLAFGAFNSFRDALTSLTSAFSSFFAGNWSEGFSHLKDAAVSSIEGIIQQFLILPAALLGAFQAIDWGMVGGLIRTGAEMAFAWFKDMGPKLLAWVMDAVAGIPWGSIWDGVQNVAGLIVGKLGDLAGAIWTWVSGAVSGINWSGLWDTVTDVTGDIVGKLGDLLGAVKDWIVANAPTAEDWKSLLSLAGDIVSGLSEKLGNLKDWAVKWITDAAPGVEQWKTLLSMAGDIVTGLSGKLGDLRAWAVKWITDAAPGVETWRALVGKAGDIVNGLSGKLGDLKAWAVKWVSDAVPGISTWKSLISKAGDIITGLSGKLGNLKSWVVKWVTDAIPGADTWLSLIGNVYDVTGDILKGLGDIAVAMKGWAEGGIAAAQAVWDTLSFDIPFVDMPWSGGDDEPSDTELPAIAAAAEEAALSITTSLQTVTDAFNNFDGSFAATVLNDKIVGAFGSFDGSSIGASIRSWIERGLTNATDGISNGTAANVAVNINNALVSGFSAMDGTSIGNAIQTWISQGLIKATEGLNDGMAKGVAVAINNALIGGLSELDGTALGAELSRWIGDALTLASVTVTTQLDTMKASFNGFVQATIGVMGGWSTGLGSNVDTTMSRIQTRVSTGTSAAKTSVVMFVQETIGVMGGWSNGIGSNVNSTMSSMQTRISTGTSAAKTSVTTFANDSASAMSNWASRTRSSADSAMSGLTGAVRSGMSTAVGAVRNGASDMVSAMSGISGRMRGAGADAIQGLIDGARGRLGGLRAVVDEAIAIMARIPAQGNSPWPMMIGAGHDAMDGLVIGVGDRFDRLSNVVTDVIGLFGQELAFANAGSVDGSATYQRPMPLSPGRGGDSGANQGHTFVVMTRSELASMFDAVDAVEVLTDPNEVRAVFGG